MKFSVLALLSAILVIAILNVIISLGILGPGAGGKSAEPEDKVYEYKVVGPREMDQLGFAAVAEEHGIEKEEGEEGELYTFPKELAEELSKPNLLVREIKLIEKDGGWEFLTVTSDHHYVFRR